MSDPHYSQTIAKLATALAKAQSEIKAAKKDTTNLFFKSKYADFSSIIDVIKKPLADNNLAYTQLIIDDGNTLVTMLIHGESGESLFSYFPLICEKKTSQAIGSAITYAKRYALSAMVGVACDDDDDGNEAARPHLGSYAKPQEKAKDAPAKADIATSDFETKKKELAELIQDARGLGAITEEEANKLFKRVPVLVVLTDLTKGIEYVSSKIVAHEKALTAEMAKV